METYTYNFFDIIFSAFGVLIAFCALVISYNRERLTIVSNNTAKRAEILKKKKSILNLHFFSIYKRSSMEQVKNSAEQIAILLENDKFYPTIIIGIGRGGAIFGSLISYYIHYSPIFCIDREYNWDTGKRNVNAFFDFNIPNKYLKRVLLVAGETHSGNTMDYFFKYLKNTLKAEEIKTCSYYLQSVCTFNIDFFGIIGEDASLMPWQNADFIRDSLNKKEGDRQKEQKKLHDD